MTIRKQIPSEGYRGAYELPLPLFEPLTSEQTAAIERGAKFFEKAFPGVRLFPDPFFEGIRSLPALMLHDLQIVVGDDPCSRKTAEVLASLIEKNWAINPLILSDQDIRSSLQSAGPLLLVGGVESNARSLEIAKKYQVGSFCSETPGAGGWGITTHRELEAGVSLRYILVCDESTREEAIGAFLSEALSADAQPMLKWAHRISPGAGVRQALPSFEAWIGTRKSLLPRLQKWLDSDRAQPYREVFVETLTGDLKDRRALTVNLMDMGVSALRFYKITGDEKGLDLFLEMLRGYWEYLHTPNPDVYVSDLDFRLGLLINEWNWIEHHPSIMPEERINFRKLLLAAMRMVKEYFEENWRHKPAPFNHHTHKVRTLILGWRYFKRWDIPDLAEWKETAEFIFHQTDTAAWKYRENAGGYEPYIPEHTITWCEATHQLIGPSMQNGLLKFAQREWAMRDNFFLLVDYGDTKPTMARSRPLEISPWLTEDTPEQQEMRDIEAACGGIFPLVIPNETSRVFALVHRYSPHRSFPPEVFTGWHRLPLDPAFAEKFGAKGPTEQLFDKLVWRSGWQPESAYIALEGTGKGTPEKKVSHAHHETNSILRMNLGGRIWLVNNGYGHRSGRMSMIEARRSRQFGPEDHNILVVRDPASGEAIAPPFNALCRDVGSAPLPFSVTELAGYGGVNWLRYLIVLPGCGFLFIDDVFSTSSTPPAGELQWNLLGERKDRRLTQNGVTLELETLGTSVPEWQESTIAAWRDLVASGSYPHTTAPPSHCILRPSQAGQIHTTFITGLWLADSVVVATWNGASGTIGLRTQKPLVLSDSTVNRPWGQLALAGHEVCIQLTPRSVAARPGAAQTKSVPVSD